MATTAKQAALVAGSIWTATQNIAGTPAAQISDVKALFAALLGTSPAVTSLQAGQVINVLRSASFGNSATPPETHALAVTFLKAALHRSSVTVSTLTSQAILEELWQLGHNQAGTSASQRHSANRLLTLVQSV